jgi:hypothetical protein
MSYFKLPDMACHDSKHTNPTGEALENALILMEMVEEFHDWYNRTMEVNSWFRTKAWNAKQGGESDSQHLLGNAVDIAFTPDYLSASKARKTIWVFNMKTRWYSICKKYGVGGGFGLYNGFFHLDKRKVKTFWDLR